MPDQNLVASPILVADDSESRGGAGNNAKRNADGWDHELIDEFEALVAVPVEAVHED
jgi:hypothetical protein